MSNVPLPPGAQRQTALRAVREWRQRVAGSSGTRSGCRLAAAAAKRSATPVTACPSAMREALGQRVPPLLRPPMPGWPPEAPGCTESAIDDAYLPPCRAANLRGHDKFTSLVEACRRRVCGACEPTLFFHATRIRHGCWIICFKESLRKEAFFVQWPLPCNLRPHACGSPTQWGPLPPRDGIRS
jgi:hypothetical protein